jgi:hypothetical protein
MENMVLGGLGMQAGVPKNPEMSNSAQKKAIIAPQFKHFVSSPFA